jgi:hypothetical protein
MSAGGTENPGAHPILRYRRTDPSHRYLRRTHRYKQELRDGIEPPTAYGTANHAALPLSYRSHNVPRERGPSRFQDGPSLGRKRPYWAAATVASRSAGRMQNPMQPNSPGASDHRRPCTPTRRRHPPGDEAGTHATQLTGYWSGRLDSNQRPPHSKCGALTWLSYAQ